MDSYFYRREKDVTHQNKHVHGFVGGILVPVLETIRRWHQIPDAHYFFAWFDDYVLGFVLLMAAWKAYGSATSGWPYLCAAWGFATGMLFLSFMGQLSDWGSTDPAPVSYTMVALIKGGLLVGCVVGLALALRGREMYKWE